ncbi:MAG: hypothetical protein QNJ12_18570 [Ilumatobacter sp.]|uniref:hypothetical protein n=1 Tax=Ilumatobacter sp. TaxID=1967498 RepID=UPI0026077EAC|nr:hypothetical protein [Ilumatobacter sp.]MDJ0770804.1 hypothetical protein [Ilumatobacter sp.]
MPDDSPWMPPSDESASTPAQPQPPALPSPWAPGGQGAVPPPAPVSPPPAATPPPPPVAAPAPPAGPQPATTTAQPAQPGFPGVTTTVETGPPAPGPSRSKWFVGGAVVAGLAIVGAGVFAGTNLVRPAQSGNETADELGFELLSAIENEDLLGVVDVLLPGEREAFRGPLVDVVSELTRLEILSPDADLSQILGVDITFEGESVEVRSTNVPDIVNVDLRADATITVDGADLPIGSLITDNMPSDMLTELRGSRATDTDVLDITLTAVERDGRWYFSAFHSIAEAARQEISPGSRIPLDGVGSDPADSPEAAFDQLLDRVEALDLTGMIRTLNPGEAAALQRYAPLFVEDGQAVLDEVPLRWQITERRFSVDEDGDSATVFLEAIAIEGTLDGASFTFSSDGNCVSLTAEGETFEQCGDTTAELDEVLGEAPALEHLLDTITEAFSDIEPVGIEMQRFEDGWYVSPTNTVSEAMLAVLRALDRQEIDDIVAAAEPAFEEVFGSLFDLDGVFSTSDPFDLTTPGGVILDDPTIDDLFANDVFSDDVSPDDVLTGEGDYGWFEEGVDDEGYFECYDLRDATEAATCFQGYVDRGEMDETFVPIELRFAECGYADVTWSGELYSLSDDEFIARAESARACFLEKVDQGLVEMWELPTEIAHLECFEGRNWYTVYDDADYDRRHEACLEAAYGAIEG